MRTACKNYGAALSSMTMEELSLASPSSMFLVLSPWMEVPLDIVIEDFIKFSDGNLQSYNGMEHIDEVKDFLTNFSTSDGEKTQNIDNSVVEKILRNEVVGAQFPGALLVRLGMGNEDREKIWNKWVAYFQVGKYKDWNPPDCKEIRNTEEAQGRLEEALEYLFRKERSEILNITKSL